MPIWHPLIALKYKQKQRREIWQSRIVLWGRKYLEITTLFGFLIGLFSLHLLCFFIQKTEYKRWPNWSAIGIRSVKSWQTNHMQTLKIIYMILFWLRFHTGQLISCPIWLTCTPRRLKRTIIDMERPEITCWVGSGEYVKRSYIGFYTLTLLRSHQIWCKYQLN